MENLLLWTVPEAQMGMGKKEVLMYLWLCPWSWTFYHFEVFMSVLKEDRGMSLL